MQLIKLSAGMGHAGNFCYPGLLEALFVTTVVIGDELALPISQEGAGMSACPAWGKVMPSRANLFCWRYSGRWSAYFATKTWASSRWLASPLSITWAGIGDWVSVSHSLQTHLPRIWRSTWALPGI